MLASGGIPESRFALAAAVTKVMSGLNHFQSSLSLGIGSTWQTTAACTYSRNSDSVEARATMTTI